MTTLHLDTELNAAKAELSEFIKYMASKCMIEGWAYRPTENAPETFKDLKEQTHGFVIPVADYGCDQTIYDSAHTNILFRFWHDKLHLEHNLGFNTQDENRVADLHLQAGREYGLSDLALRVLEADTRGQVAYYAKHKKFVVNQAAFVDSYIQHGERIACAVRH
jgi:hypothetical protein